MVPASLQASQPPARAAVGTHRSAGRYSGVPVTTSKLCMLFFFSLWCIFQPLTPGAGSCLCALFPNSCLRYFLAAACKHCRYTSGFRYLICCKRVTRVGIRASYHITSGTAISARLLWEGRTTLASSGGEPEQPHGSKQLEFGVGSQKLVQGSVT